MTPGEGGANGARGWVARAWASPRALTWLGAGLILLGIGAAAGGRRHLLNLSPEEPARSVRRFATGAAEVEVTTQLPWSRLPAVLPGPADAWAGSTAHTISMRPVLPTRQALRLYIQISRARPHDVPVSPGIDGGSSARVRVLVNGTELASFQAPSASRPPAAPEPRAPPRVVVLVPSTALGSIAPAHIALVNDSGPAVAFRRLRLIEASPSFAPGHFLDRGQFPFPTAILLLAGLTLFVRARLLKASDQPGRPRWRAALGPLLSLLLLTLAVVGPWAAHSLPRGAWLLLILLVLPAGRGRPRPASRRPPAARRARAAGNALLVVVSLAVSLVAAELVLRIAFRDEPWVRSTLRRPGPPLLEHMNYLGFDEREFPREKPPGTYRIAVLGDSLSVSVPRVQRFGSVVADALNRRAPPGVRYESLNFGKTGIDTYQETAILHDFVWGIHPDFVLLEFYVNDLENGDYADRPHRYPMIPGETAFAERLRGVIEGTVLGKAVTEQYRLLQDHFGIVETYAAYMYERFGDPDRRRWREAADEIRAFIQECRAHDTPLAIALWPHPSPGLSGGAYEFAELYDQVMELCRTESATCVDLRSAFAPYRDYMSLWVHRFDPHPNARAHRIAGERLVEVLGSFWLEGGARVARGQPPLGQPRMRAPSGS